MSVNESVLNDKGNRTMIFLGGGQIDDGGIDILPLDQHPDYTEFLNNSIAANWRILILSGQAYPDYYSVMVAIYAKKYASQDGKKPILVGHSAGGVAGLCYARDRPADSYFDTITLFNVPLIYPYVNTGWLQSFYQETQRITANVNLIMSSNDQLMRWKLGTVTMSDAIDAIRNAGKINVDIVTDIPLYQHSPFSPVDVAWDKLRSKLTELNSAI